VSSAERKLPEPGELIGGKYRIIRRIGEGGMGVVYEAMHTRLQQRVAIKMLLPEMLDYPFVVPRFEREARAAGKLRSDNTARVLDVDVSDGMPFMVMEFLEGADLGQILETDGALAIPDAVDCVMQGCNAMAEAHAQGIVHRDLKPSNLFVIAGMKVKLLDFGISKLESDGDARVTATQTVVGTPLYMSPEQVRSAKHVDARSDIWSLGIILYELLTQRTPFEGSMTAAAAAICIDTPPPIAQFRNNVPKGLEDAILGALEKDPNARVQSVQAFAASIAPYGSGRISLPGGEPLRPMSGRVLPFHSDPTLPQLAPVTPRAPASSATLPGWTTRLHPGKRRTGWVLALFAAGAVGVGAIVARQSSRHLPPAEQPNIAAQAAEHVVPSPSVSNDVALASPTNLGPTNVALPTATAATTATTTHAQQQPHTHPTVTPTTTATATAPATHTVAPPAPTRL
jgi:serine/threonine protein kinase